MWCVVCGMWGTDDPKVLTIKSTSAIPTAAIGGSTRNSQLNDAFSIDSILFPDAQALHTKTRKHQSNEFWMTFIFSSRLCQGGDLEGDRYFR
jgi:hypothetical protein